LRRRRDATPFFRPADQRFTSAPPFNFRFVPHSSTLFSNTI
jgi:hypothetical protein